MKSTPSAIALSILLSTALSSSSFAFVVFDAGDDYSPTSNPNGAWSYGYSTVANPGVFVLYDTTQFLLPGLSVWDSSALTDNPTVSNNMTSSAISLSTATWQPYELALHPGRNAEFSIIRFTAPSSGSYDLEGSFRGIDVVGATTDVSVLLNGSSLFNDELNLNGNGNTALYTSTVTMNAGDTLDFRVGDGGNGPLFDSTGLEAVVIGSSIPEPTTASLGLVALGLLARRRRSNA